MRVALLVVILALASLGWNWDARAEFNCFETPGEGSRCACIGANDCTEMKNSDNCKSEAACDKGELGDLQLQGSASFKGSWAAATTLSLLWVISGPGRADSGMSAFPSRANMLSLGIDVRFVPIAEAEEDPPEATTGHEAWRM